MVAATTRAKPLIAIATGDPAGIGPEVSLKAALDPAARAACNMILVGDPAVLARHAEACDLKPDTHVIDRVGDADWSNQRVNVLTCPQPDGAGVQFGVAGAAGGRASLACASLAIGAALAGDADAVVAAPQNETAIALAGIQFDGYPSFVARTTGTDENDAYLMLCFGGVRIVHATLHRSVRQAIDMITREKILGAITAAARALVRLGVQAPRICVGGLNPHAGEGGLFGREEIEIIGPAIDVAVARGIHATGPFGADTMFHRRDADAFVVMLHDQGHIAAKLMAPNATAALTIGTPVLFASVAHGSAHDIAGRGVADPSAMIDAVLRLAQRPAAVSPGGFRAGIRS